MTSHQAAQLDSLLGTPEYRAFCQVELDDPYPLLDELRSVAPVHWSPLLEAWVITARGFDLTEYQELGDLVREGLEVVAGAPIERRAMLLEMAAFADFLQERIALLHEEWIAHRDALRAAGELPGEIRE